MKKVFPDKPMVAYRRPPNLKYELVRAKVRRENDDEKGMKKYGKPCCQICGFVDEGCKFQGGRTYFVNFPFHCDSSGVVYILSCKTCQKIYVGSTITSSRKRFDYHKNRVTRYGKGQRGMVGEQLCAH